MVWTYYVRELCFKNMTYKIHNIKNAGDINKEINLWPHYPNCPLPHPPPYALMTCTEALSLLRSLHLIL